MGKLVVSIWMSMDGVFDADLMGERFQPYDSQQRQDYIRDSILGSDALLFGRVTYEMLAPYWSTLRNNEMGVAAKLNSAPKYVVSSSLPRASWENSTIIRGEVEAEIRRLKKKYPGEIQVEGSATLAAALAGAGLIDEIRLLVHPVLMGRGKRFPIETAPMTRLVPLETRALDKGVLLLRYAAASTAEAGAA